MPTLRKTLFMDQKCNGIFFNVSSSISPLPVTRASTADPPGKAAADDNKHGYGNNWQINQVTSCHPLNNYFSILLY